MLEALRRLVRFLRVSNDASGDRATRTTAQYFVLSQLAEAPASSIRALADRTMTDPSSVSVVAAKLETLGLIAREPDPEDRRRASLTLTPRGRRALARAPELPQFKLFKALAAMPASRRKSVAEALDLLVRAVGADAESAPMFFEDELPTKKPRAARGAK